MLAAGLKLCGEGIARREVPMPRLLAGSALAAALLLAAGTRMDWELRAGASGGQLHWSFEQGQCQATTGRSPTTAYHMGVHHWACITCKRAQSQACRAITKNRHQHWHQHHLVWVAIAAAGLFLLTIVAIIQSRGEEQPVGGRSPHRHNGRSSGPGTPVRHSSARRLYDSPSAALLPESFMSPEAVELQDSQPSEELAGHLAKARRSSQEKLKDADLDDLDFISRSTAFISKSIFGSPELRV